MNEDYWEVFFGPSGSLGQVTPKPIPPPQKRKKWVLLDPVLMAE